MNAVLPMLYEVDAVKAKTTPKVVGNTRGAVLLSDKIFAGLETPTGKNSVGGLETMGEFSPNSWTDQAFSWTPGEAAPQELLKQFKAEEIAGTRGYVNFKEKGEQHFTFTYKEEPIVSTLLVWTLSTLRAKWWQRTITKDLQVAATGKTNIRSTFPKLGSTLFAIL